MLAAIINLTYLSILIGMLLSSHLAFKKKEYRKILFIFLIPFYVFYFILKLPENDFKKRVAIMTIGAFWVFLFASILKIVFTPPV